MPRLDAGRGQEDAIADLLMLYRYRFGHFRPARTEHGWRTPMQGHSGFPDFIACRLERDGTGRLVALESKFGHSRVTPGQDIWLRHFRLAGATTAVVTPEMLRSGELEAMLR